MLGVKEKKIPACLLLWIIQALLGIRPSRKSWLVYCCGLYRGYWGSDPPLPTNNRASWKFTGHTWPDFWNLGNFTLQVNLGSRAWGVGMLQVKDEGLTFGATWRPMGHSNYL